MTTKPLDLALHAVGIVEQVIRDKLINAYPEVTETLENLKSAEIGALLDETFMVQQVSI